MTNSLKLVQASSQYAKAGDSVSLSITGELTVELWTKLSSFPSGGLGDTARMLICKLGDGGVTYTPWNFEITDTHRLIAGVIKDSHAAVNAVAYALMTGVVINKWYHFAFTFDPTTNPRIKVYMNGTEMTYQIRAGLADSIWDSSGDQIVGGGSSTMGATVPTNYTDGKISLVRIWNVVRTQQEIKNNRCNNIISETGLVASWSLDNIYTDSSGNNNTLTPMNAPVFDSDVPDCLQDHKPFCNYY